MTKSDTKTEQMVKATDENKKLELEQTMGPTMQSSAKPVVINNNSTKGINAKKAQPKRIPDVRPEDPSFARGMNDSMGRQFA
jgi:DNA-binding transcriptional regulator of glucitol operon